MPQPEGLPPGVYPYLTMEEYHADPAIGSSGIKNLLVSPRRYWFNSPLNPKRVLKKKTKAMKFGTAYHAYWLEPENFDNYIAIEPDKWTPAKEHPEKLSMEKQKAAWLEANSIKTVISTDEFETMKQMYYALQTTPEHLNALRYGVPECSIFWRDESGVMCKIRVDNFTPEWISDLKTTTSIEDKNLRYEFPKRGYEISGAMYSIGMLELKKMIAAGYQMPQPFTDDFVKKFMAMERQHFAFVFQEKEYPFITRLWRMTSWSTEIGYAKFQRGMAIYYENKDVELPWSSGFAPVEDITEDMVSASVNY